MKLIIQANRIAATATDDYGGPDEHIEAPADFDPARMGEYRYEGGELVLPEPVPQTRVTKLAFRNRFTTAEKAALEIAALDDPAATMPARLQAATLRAYLADVAAATFVDLQRPDTRAGVQMLEDAGLIGAGRALEVLDAPIQPEERPL